MSADLQPLPAPDPTIDSSNPVLLANLAMLAKMGAPSLPDGVTFIDQVLISPLGTLPFHATVFHAKVKGEWVDHVSSDYLLAAFPIVAYNELLGKGMITPGPGTPNVPVFQLLPSADKPMLYDPHTTINGKNPNPGDFGIPVPDASVKTTAPLAPGKGIFNQ